MVETASLPPVMLEMLIVYRGTILTHRVVRLGGGGKNTKTK